MHNNETQTLHGGRNGRAMHESVHDDKGARREAEAIAFEAAMDAEEALAASLGYGLAAIERAFTPSARWHMARAQEAEGVLRGVSDALDLDQETLGAMGGIPSEHFASARALVVGVVEDWENQGLGKAA